MKNREYKSGQTPSSVIMVRPHHFNINEQTEDDNAFQAKIVITKAHAKLAYQEITEAVKELERHGVHVHLFEGESKLTPDSVFSNNWFSCHSGGHIAIYPMKSEKRRSERRSDIMTMLKSQYRVRDIIDYSGLEADGLFLEGTGSMVLDHIERVAYAVQSNRTSLIALERFCTHFNYEPMVFDAADTKGTSIYHTNVLMSIGTDFALLGTNMISDMIRRDEIVSRLEASGRSIIHLTESQISNFCGNAIELQGKGGRLFALSKTAFDALEQSQISKIEESAMLLPLAMPTIELSGGSVRCTIAGIHLAKR